MPAENLLVMDERHDVLKRQKNSEENCFTFFPVFFRLWGASPEETFISSNQPLTVSNVDDDDEKTKDTCAVLTDDENSVAVREVPSTDGAHTEDARDPPPPVAEACMAVCHCCEKQISRNWRFCAHCGMYLEMTTTRRAKVVMCDRDVQELETTSYSKLVMDSSGAEELTMMAIVEDESGPRSAKEMCPEEEDHDLREFARLQKSFHVQEMNLSAIQTTVTEDEDENFTEPRTPEEVMLRAKMGLIDTGFERDVDPHDDEDDNDFMELAQDDSFDLVQENLLDELG